MKGFLVIHQICTSDIKKPNIRDIKIWGGGGIPATETAMDK